MPLKSADPARTATRSMSAIIWPGGRRMAAMKTTGKGQYQTTQLAGDERHLDRSAAGHMLLAVEITAGGNEMYGMSGPELLTQLKMRDTLRDAERIHQASTVLKERKAEGAVSRLTSALKTLYSWA